MRIESIRIRNWMPFEGDFSLELPSGAIAVTARYDGNPRRSNWGGKTAFLEAIEWALFGVHRKRLDDDVIFREAKDTEVAIALSGGVEVTRSRKRGSATRLKVVDNGETLTKGVAEDRVRTALGFSHADYRATVCFAQGDTEAIVGQTSSKRRDVISYWLDLEAWKSVAARARAHLRLATEEYKRVSAELDLRRRDLEGVDDARLALEIEGYRKAVATAAETLESVEARLEMVALAEMNRQDTERLATVNEQRRELRDQIRNAPTRDPNAVEQARASAVAAKAACKQADDRYYKARALVRGEFDGVCPVNDRPCPVSDDLRADDTAARANLKVVSCAREEALQAGREAKAYLQDVETRERATERLRARYNALSEQARTIKAAIEEREVADAPDDAEAAELRETRRALREGHTASNSALEVAMDEQRRVAASREWIREHAELLEQMQVRLAAAQLAYRATSPSGIPASIAEASLWALEERANFMLGGTGLSFTFAWDRATTALSPTCEACGYQFKGQRDKSCPACEEPRGYKRSDALEILTEDGSGEVEDARLKSGGAKVLLASAIRLGAGMLLRERRDARCAWAQVDEPFGALDAENRVALAHSFVGLLGSVGLEQAFVVSHDTALLDALPGRIEIVRAGDRSTLEVLR